MLELNIDWQNRLVQFNLMIITELPVFKNVIREIPRFSCMCICGLAQQNNYIAIDCPHYTPHSSRHVSSSPNLCLIRHQLLGILIFTVVTMATMCHSSMVD